MPWISLGLIVLGVLLLVVGGELLLRGSVRLAVLLRLTPTVIGLTVVAAGTSVPELAVSGFAVWQGKTDMAVANVVGSNVFNVTVIVGLSALILPIATQGNTVRLEYPVLAIVTLLAVVLTQEGEINRLEAILCLTIHIAFTAYLVSLVRGQVTAEESEEFHEEVEELAPGDEPPSLGMSILYVLLGAGLLSGGAHCTVAGASHLAELLGWSERTIGLTIVACGTGLPEVVASIISSVRGRSDVAIGNVIGSNLFNTLVILGVNGLIAPLPVEANVVAYDNWWMLGVTLLLFPLMLTGMRISRWEGVLLLVVYATYMATLIYSAGDADSGAGLGG